MYSRAEKFSIVGKGLVYLVLILWAFYAILPLYWVFTTAFKPQAETQAWPPTVFPSRLTLQTFITLFTKSSFRARPFLNSIIISSGGTLIAVVVSSLAGYGFSRFRFPLRRTLLLSLLLIRLLPTLIMIIPLYRIFISYRLYNTYQGLILIHGVTAAPFCTWLMFGYFESISYELEEAALIDGCSFMRSLWHVLLPLATPGMAAVGIFAWLEAWNDFTYAVVLTSTELIKPYTVVLYNMIQERSFVQWDLLSAAAFVAVVPILITFGIFQKYFVTGLTQGALKG
jgi:multiple sugar transport system permease protein